MAFASLKKKIAISNRLVETYTHYLQDVSKRAMQCFEPGANIHVRPMTNQTGSHNQPAREIYPHAELMLAECCAKYSSEFGQDSSLGSALDTASDGYRQLTDAKVRAVDEIQSRFSHPIAETLSQELAEISKLCKKTNSRRLAYEVLRNKAEKGKMNVQEPDYVETEQKFRESYETSRSAMTNFLECEPEQVEIICNLVSAQLSFYQDAQAVLTDLQTRMQLKLKEARSPDAPKQLEAVLEHKEKHQNASGPEPVCRALYDFVAENPFELSFREGDLIKMMKQVDGNWYLGTLHGVEGHFPTTYVEILVPLPASEIENA